MRMWNVNPSIMCRQHLLGEHLEMHMFAGAISKGKDISGYLRGGLVNPEEIKERHDALVMEMERRGMNHASPMRSNPRLKQYMRVCTVDEQAVRRILLSRCDECRKRVHNGVL